MFKRGYPMPHGRPDAPPIGLRRARQGKVLTTSSGLLLLAVGLLFNTATFVGQAEPPVALDARLAARAPLAATARRASAAPAKIRKKKAVAAPAAPSRKTKTSEKKTKVDPKIAKAQATNTMVSELERLAEPTWKRRLKDAWKKLVRFIV
eukprot:TRINITY_DN52912_c0_g1_i2.p2 TRINITY_DN52912_c0_g1~~TRINITY_DN52912_c0_g1_i2.p2  ORF type:complete len:150 (-),score=31.33 TRINITY_DN52912_c0_g1_i2:315-764(-)